MAGEKMHTFQGSLISGDEFETNDPDYLKSLAVQEAIYESSKTKQPVDITF